MSRPRPRDPTARRMLTYSFMARVIGARRADPPDSTGGSRTSGSPGAVGRPARGLVLDQPGHEGATSGGPSHEEAPMSRISRTTVPTRRLRVVRAEDGITTAEYAVGTAAGAGLAGVLYTMLTGGFGDQLLTTLFDHVLGLLGIG